MKFIPDIVLYNVPDIVLYNDTVCQGIMLIAKVIACSILSYRVSQILILAPCAQSLAVFSATSSIVRN